MRRLALFAIALLFAGHVGAQTLTPPAGGSGGTPGGSTGDIQYNNAGAFGGSAATINGGGAILNPVNGALSTPAISLTGSWITGGTATTTSPQITIDQAASATGNWSTSGTGIGIQLTAAGTFAGNVIDIEAPNDTFTGNGLMISIGGLGTCSGNPIRILTNNTATATMTLDCAGDLIVAKSLSFAGKPVLFINTAPTVASGFGATSPTVVANNGTAAFTVNVGTGTIASTGVITMPSSTNGWACKITDLTTKSASVGQTLETATTATSVTVGNYTDVMATGSWTASDVLQFNCTGY